MNEDANNEVSGTVPGHTGEEDVGNRGRSPVEDFRLRPERPPVMRLSRKVLAGLAGVSGLAILGALIFALDSNRRASQTPQELFNTANKTTADGLAALPTDYTGIPQLGPHLPGDLGRPMLNAHTALPSVSGFDTVEQRIAQESKAARTSHLFATTSARERTENLPSIAAASTAGGPQAASLILDEKAPLDPGSLQNMQDRKLAFLNGATDRRTVSFDRLENPASSYIVQAGTVIPAALITGIQSDLPGQITAQVTENVFDTPTGRFLLIPQGAKLIGTYDSQVSFGQSRVLLVWNRIIFPNGKSIVLEHQPGADTEGYAGSRTISTIIGAAFSKQQPSRPFSASAAKSVRPAPKAISFKRCAAAARIRSTGPASSSCAAKSMSSRPSPSGPASRSGSSSIVISCSRPITYEDLGFMPKLKLSTVLDDKPVKLTIDLPAAIHRDLAAYAELLATETGQAAIDPIKLILPMLMRFMASDRAFAKAKRAKD